jgi:PRTRC genetic system protein F
MIALALPRIGATVPRAIVPGASLKANAAVSRFLVEADVFDENDIPATWTDSLDACRQALDHWIKREIGPLHCLNPRFSLRLLSKDGHCHGDFNPPLSDSNFGGMEIAWGEYGEEEWPVGAALEALNRLLPGLGKAVLDVLIRQSHWAYPVFTPDIAYDMARYLYWYGEDDEELALQECCGDDQQARDAMRDEMVCRTTLERAYPVWAMDWRRGRELPRCARLLRRAVKRLNDPEAKAVAADALALCALEGDHGFRPEIDGEYIGFGAVLSWARGDVTVRIYDDLRNSALQGEFSDVMGEARAPADNPHALGQWRLSMKNHFEAIRRIDALIYRLSEGDWGRR